MFVVYPLVATAAGISLVEAANLAALIPASLLALPHGGASHVSVTRLMVYGVLLVSGAVGASRFATLALSFSAPLKVVCV